MGPLQQTIRCMGHVVRAVRASRDYRVRSKKANTEVLHRADCIVESQIIYRKGPAVSKLIRHYIPYDLYGDGPMFQDSGDNRVTDCRTCLTTMCEQIDKKYECGHTGFHDIKWCQNVGRGCMGPGAQHETVAWSGLCTDCANRQSDPNPQR
ncbi:hypothetical protein CkaCkLH20_06517 [Colletotrichum karsti]|uniref:Uncharacterized protein n=1 Tax=Colletotrichum karsti TaxID=1095194 RepID=A0A9P6I6Q1_9PEZI|nr:uncharacterized protein CkaCkLH20_06517 [Colletotrichum karsti]KAF9876071.1 hypothetical protein CkaCkLH20_06517 [Colletotrichum karsti]